MKPSKLDKPLSRIEKSLTTLLEKFNACHDDSGRFATGSGGRFTSGGGGSSSGSRISGTSPGGKESYNDKIEGTQKEADREVTRYNAKEAKVRKQFEEAKKKQSLGQEKISSLQKDLSDVQDKKKSLQADLEKSQSKIAELRAKLAAYKKAVTKDELLSSMDKAIGMMRAVIKGFRDLGNELDKISSQLK